MNHRRQICLKILEFHYIDIVNLRLKQNLRLLVCLLSHAQGKRRIKNTFTSFI